MNPGDLVVKHTHDYLTAETDVGIILGGAWQEGFFNILFARSGPVWVRRGTIRRIGLRPPTSSGVRSSSPTVR